MFITVSAEKNWGAMQSFPNFIEIQRACNNVYRLAAVSYLEITLSITT